MTLSVRPTQYIVPTYSLTGDLLAYLTCGLQYRYYNKGALPPSKPVQRWFGQFIHGVMEESYRQWQTTSAAFPWTDAEIVPVVELVIRRLAAQGLHFQTYLLLGIALERAHVTINTWAPFLFPLISECEVHLQGVRQMPAGARTIRQSRYYEVGGVADVITDVGIAAGAGSNPIIGAITDADLGPPPFEIVVDYKGMRRPPASDSEDETWLHHEWQVITYAWLRDLQTRRNLVRAGVLLYLNELVPSNEDMDRLYAEVHAGDGRTDLLPTGEDLEFVNSWPTYQTTWQGAQTEWVGRLREWWRGDAHDRVPFPRMPSMDPGLSFGYRFLRSLRVIKVNLESVQRSLARFDGVVGQIEESVWRESTSGVLTTSWTPRPREETCTACDAKTFCPAPGNRYRGAPSAP